MQIQKVKNALMAPFLFSDKIGEANNTLNVFTLRIKELVDEFVEFFIQGEKGAEKVTEFGYQIRDFVIAVMEELLGVVRQLKQVFLEQEAGLDTFQDLLFLAVKPMEIMLKILDKLSPNMLTWIVYMKVASKLMPINTIMSLMAARAMMTLALATNQASGASATYTSIIFGETIAKKLASIQSAWQTFYIGAENAATQGLNLTRMQSIYLLYAQATAWIANNAAMLIGIAGVALIIYGITSLSGPMNALIGVLILGAAAWMAFNGSMTMGVGIAAAVGGILIGIGVLKTIFPKAEFGGATERATSGGYTGGTKSLKQQRMDT
jgi:hypothetical protein